MQSVLIAFGPARGSAAKTTFRPTALMPHVQVIAAQKTLLHKEQYPEVIVSAARALVQWHEGKRAAIEAMACKENRALWHLWLNFRRQSSERSQLGREREATRLLTKHLVLSNRTRDAMSVLHVARQFVGRTQSANALQFAIFAAMLELHECTDFGRIYQYLSCVNAKRHDASLSDVSFLRWCGTSAASEILAWKLKRLHENVHAND